MEKKLSQHEREEVVTKGYLEDVLEQKDYVTNEYFHNTLEKVLESKNYVTKEYAHDLFETFEKKIDLKLDEIKKDTRQYMEALMEDNRSQILILIEVFDSKIERIHRHVGMTSV